MEPQGRGNVPALHTPERNKRLGLRKTTLASRESARSNSWAECRDTKKFRHRAEGEIFLLTFPLIGRLARRHRKLKGLTDAPKYVALGDTAGVASVNSRFQRS